MKYWYFKFDYSNVTRDEVFEYERVIKSSKEHFPLKEVREMIIQVIEQDSEKDPKTDLNSDDFSAQIMNQVQINKEDFISFNEED